MKPLQPPTMVLCAGLKSSGSTWAYNAAIQILKAGSAKQRRSGRNNIAAFYADKLESFPAEARQATCLVVKTHIPSPAVVLLAQLLRARVIISVREPRDAIASLLQRFDHPFDGSLRELAAGATCLISLSDGTRPMILRYEERFYDRIETVAQIADFLGVRLPRQTLARIHRSLTPKSVSRRIATLRRKGIFGKRPTSDSFDPLTHWHPGHVGDGRIGKYSGVLSSAQQRAVMSRMREYRSKFGYASKPKT
jgi:hypothetical protein